MSNKNIEATGNLVESYMLGNVQIEIRDSAYINRTQEDINRTLENLNRIATRIVMNASIEQQN